VLAQVLAVLAQVLAVLAQVLAVLAQAPTSVSKYRLNSVQPELLHTSVLERLSTQCGECLHPEVFQQTVLDHQQHNL
jgi:hypothetical protein